MIYRSLLYESRRQKYPDGNGGSSSIKFALFEADRMLPRILTGQIAGIGTAFHHDDGRSAARSVYQLLDLETDN